MGELLTKWFGPSYRTSIGGILAAVPPLIIAAALATNITLGKWVMFALTLSISLGGLMLGINAKDRQVHSTVAEVEASAGHDVGVPPLPPPVPIVASKSSLKS
jgi:hypothetical protein